MIYELDPHYPGFPNPEESEPDGLIAIGGDLSPERLINAYCCGIFPWYDDSEPILWWSLDPRMVLFPGRVPLQQKSASRSAVGQVRGENRHPF